MGDGHSAVSLIMEIRLLVARLRIGGYSVPVMDVPSVGQQNLCSWVVLGFKSRCA